MLIKNLVQGQLVNGSIGKVTRFGTLSELAQDETLAKIGEKDGVFRPDSTRSSLPARAWPVVKFINGDERVITPVDFEINNAEGKMEARRVQVPLILAWALSVHKSQGQTLERVKVDLRRTFEKGQGQCVAGFLSLISDSNVPY
jgi:ATP-dependent exoDNAse (exonuclease V) alpha subunit